MLASMRRLVTVTAPEVRIADRGVTLRSRVVTVRPQQPGSGGGSGGGGDSHARPVAAIVIGPEGVAA